MFDDDTIVDLVAGRVELVPDAAPLADTMIRLLADWDAAQPVMREVRAAARDRLGDGARPAALVERSAVRLVAPVPHPRLPDLRAARRRVGKEESRSASSSSVSQPPRARGQPDDIAWAAVHMASEEASFVNAQVLSPKGGVYVSQ